jgi:hypothetical protein
MNNLGDMLDYAVYDCEYEPEDFWAFFMESGIADAFGKGNPKYVTGLSGPELASEVLYRTFGSRPAIQASDNIDKSPEYWAGWILAYYQWHTALRFFDINEYGLTIQHVLSLYPTLHEADITKFVAVADKVIGKVGNEKTLVQFA